MRTLTEVEALAALPVDDDVARELAEIVAEARRQRRRPKILARLAVDQRHQGAGLGRSLLQDVLLRCVEAAEAIGARVLLVHAKHDAAKAWYIQFGFEESPTDPLHEDEAPPVLHCAAL